MSTQTHTCSLICVPENGGVGVCGGRFATATHPNTPTHPLQTGSRLSSYVQIRFVSNQVKKEHRSTGFTDWVASKRGNPPWQFCHDHLFQPICLPCRHRSTPLYDSSTPACRSPATSHLLCRRWPTVQHRFTTRHSWPRARFSITNHTNGRISRMFLHNSSQNSCHLSIRVIRDPEMSSNEAQTTSPVEKL